MGSNSDRDEPCERRLRPADYLRLVLGTHPTQLGWALIGFGMVFVWGLAVKADYAGVVRFAGPLDTAAGEVTDCREGFGTENESEIFACDYRFTGPDGQLYNGVSYGSRRRPRVGGKVTVEFPQGDPGAARVVGLRRGVFPPWAGFVVALPLGGIVCVGLGYGRARRARRLLTAGALGSAALTGKTDVDVGEGILVEWAFTFAASDRREYTLRHRTDQTVNFGGGSGHPVAYDPADPAGGVLLDTLPGRPQVSPGGDIAFAAAPSWWTVLIMPVVSVVGHGAYGAIHLAAGV